MASENPEITKLQRWLSRHFVSLVMIYWHLDEQGNSKGQPFVSDRRASLCRSEKFGSSRLRGM